MAAKLPDTSASDTVDLAGSLGDQFGRFLLWGAPKLMKFLSIAGTAAMFLVGGGILVHGVPALHHLAEAAKAFPPGWLWENLFNAAVGIAAGAVIVGAVMLLRRLRGKPAVAPH